ncbi:MAG: S-layer homology domain-containing protein [Oscillospiraceae bacterium]|nr:S-layer homology domain-containing protein [Oscillospiraceae bacterium]
MANSLKKFIAVLSASAVVASVMPIAFADTEDEIDEAAEVVEVAEVDEIEEIAEVTELETAEDGVIYNEDFENFELGTLVNLGTTSNTSFADNGFNFGCAGGRDSDQAQVGISVVNDTTNGRGLNMFALKYNDGGARRPFIKLTNSGSAHKFVNDVVVNVDIKFTAAGNILNLLDSNGTPNAVAVTATDDMLGKWINATVVSSGETTYIIVTDKATSAVISFSTSATVLKDVAEIRIKDEGTASNSVTIDNLYIADEEYVLPDEVILDAAVNSLVIAEGQMGLEVIDGVYHVKRDIGLPTVSEGASVEWNLSQRAIDDESAAWEATSFVTIEDDILVLKATADSANYYVKATATITVNDLTAVKEFLFVVEQISDEEAAIKYDENFDSFPAGTIVNMSNGSNGSYKDTNGFTFTCGTRGGDYDALGVFSVTKSGTDNYLQLKESNYAGQGRQPVVNLIRTSEDNFKRAVYLDMELNFSSINGELQIVDASGTILSITPLDDTYLNKWLHYVISSSSGTTIAVYDGDTAISYYTDDHSLKNVAKFTTPDKVFGTIGINNLVIADKAYKTPDADIVAAAKANIDITDLTVKDGVYTATADFQVPAAPVGATVTWKAMQKAKGSDTWEESSFITVAGTNATINPTDDIDNYDVKLVATIKSGEVSEDVEFIIALPNPMNELTGFIASHIPVVNTTDKDAANKTITFDLSGEDVLKYDLVLPVTSRTYKNTTAAWTSSDSEHISIAADGTATIMTSDLNTHDVTLTAVVTYKKGNITYSSEEQKFTVKMGYTSEDVASDDATFGKYKVRFDKAYDANFTAIPSNTTSNITFPTKGYFGSVFSWNSSVPNVISNQGKVTRASTAKSVILAALIVSGEVSDEKQFTVSVPGTGTGGGGGGGGSTSSTGTTSKNTGSGSIATPTTSAVEGSGSVNGEEVVNKLLEEKAQSQDLFTDLSSARWASDAINGLAKAGVINGVTDTLFAPNDTVTRAQFAKMLMGAFGLTASAYTTSSFADVSTDAWYFDAVETAYNLGIINGIEDGVFAPDALITRQDMAVMVTRAAEAAGKTIPEVTGSKSFGDANRISDYAVDAVDTLVKAGIINGITDAMFAPLDNATRAQAAKILYNFL